MVNIFKKMIHGGSKKEIDKSHINSINEDNNDFGQLIDNGNFDDWLEEGCAEGQLSIDVYQTPKDLVIKSTIAGVKTEDIDISINNDMLTIRGKRELAEDIKTEDYLYKECYWGAFSRSVILPMEVKTEKINAYLEDGVLTITLPKAKPKNISIKVKER